MLQLRKPLKPVCQVRLNLLKMLWNTLRGEGEALTSIARKKAEREAMLAAEEASLPTKTKAAPKAGTKKKADKDKPLAATGAGIAAYGLNDPLGLRAVKGEDGEPEPITEFSANEIEGMLEAMELVNQKTNKDAMGAKVLPISLAG